MMQILNSLNEEQLFYIYAYIKEYFQIDSAIDSVEIKRNKRNSHHANAL